MGRTLGIALPLGLLSLLAGAYAVYLANFGAPVWVFVLLLGWLATVGLPCTLAVLCVAFVWEGLSLAAFLVSAGLLALSCETLAVHLGRRLLARRRARRAA